MLKHGLRCLAAGFAIALGGCSDYYLERRDTIFLGAGEAVQTNIITHQINPWPAHARQTRGATDGERLQRAVERYRNPRSGADAAGAQAGAAAASTAAPRAP